MLHKAWNSKGEMPYCFPRSSIKFQGHTGQNITDFDPNWAFLDYRPVAAFKSIRFALFFIWNQSNTMNVYSALWILMAWCFSTKASVATVLTTHPCVSQCLRVKLYGLASFWKAPWCDFLIKNSDNAIDFSLMSCTPWHLGTITLLLWYLLQINGACVCQWHWDSKVQGPTWSQEDTSGA